AGGRVAGLRAVAELAVVAGDIGGVRAVPAPVALVGGTEVPVAGADRRGGRRAVGGLVARTVVALGPVKAGIATANALPDHRIAGLGPVAEDPVIRAVDIRHARSLSPGNAPARDRDRRHRHHHQQPRPHASSPRCWNRSETITRSYSRHS